MIEAENISRAFGRLTALHQVSFRIEAGEFVLLAGPNGAGKTTLLRILAGFAPPSAGCARIAGHDLFDEAEAARAQLGYVPENLPMYNDMRVAEYLRFRGRLRRLPRRKLRRRIGELSDQFALASLRRTMIGALARGQRARVALADALLHEPPVLLLDDPLAALDAEQRAAVVDLLRGACSGTAVLLATHVPDEAAGLFTRILLLRTGRLLRDEAREPGAHPPQALSDTLRLWLAAPSPPPAAAPVRGGA